MKGGRKLAWVAILMVAAFVHTSQVLSVPNIPHLGGIVVQNNIHALSVRGRGA